MLERPDLQDERIVACLREEYGLEAAQITFLPLGADRNTAVYRAVAQDETPYFVKLRRGGFDTTSVALPRFLSDLGISQIIAPRSTTTDQLCAALDHYTVILYPFVEGSDGYEVRMADHQWRELGSAFKRIHTAAVPATLSEGIQRESYSPQWREKVRAFLGRLRDGAPADPVALELQAFLADKRDKILDLVGRAERLGWILRAASPEFVLCHSDIHAGNVLIEPTGALRIVDWDNPIMAPKERDLMFIGGGLWGEAGTPQEEETPFYQGYGQAQIDPAALACYRYERIVEDIAVDCDQILPARGAGQDRERSLLYLKSNFLPNHTIEIAYGSDKATRDGSLRKSC